MIFEALQYPFFVRALIAGVLASIASGIIGSYIVVKKMSGFSGGLAHAVFGGIGFAHFMGFSPTLGALGFGVICSTLMSLVYRLGEKVLDPLISIIWSVGMALGVVFISVSPGYAPDLNSYLFGSILFVPQEYLYLIACLDFVIIGIVWLCYKEFQALSFDEEFAEIAGVPIWRMFLLLLLLITFAVIALIRIIGIILTIALLTLPAVIARQWTKSLPHMMILASLFAAILTIIGLFLSCWSSEIINLNLPSGPLIIILLGLTYCISTVVSRLRFG